MAKRNARGEQVAMRKPKRTRRVRKETSGGQPRLPLPIRGRLLAMPKADAEPPCFDEIRHPKKRAYLVALSASPSLNDAASAAGIDRTTGWLWRRDERDSAFQAALARARTLGLEAAVSEAWRRAIEGVEEPVYQGGRLVGTIMRKSDTMLIFMLKGEFPEKYRERYEHAGVNGGPIELVARASAEVDTKLAYLSARMDQLMARLPKTLPELPSQS